MPSTKAPYYTESLLAVALALTLTVLGVIGIYVTRLPSINSASLVQAQPLEKIQAQSIFFATPVFLDRSKTFISLPYQLGDGPQIIWLTLQTPAKTEPITRLVTHPLLTDLDWTYLEADGYRLYQRRPVYNSLTDFTKDPPPSEKVITEPAIAQNSRFAPLQLTRFLPDKLSENLDPYDFVLTTYTSSRADGRLVFYETVLDAASAFVSPEQKLNWQLFAPLASEANPFYLGDIRVDYRQY